MTDYVYTPKVGKPYTGKTPLFSLKSFDTLMIESIGNYRFESQYASFAILGGSNTITNNAHLWRYGGGWAFYGDSSNNEIINNASILGNGGIFLSGGNNRITNNYDIRVIPDWRIGDAIKIIGNEFSIANVGLIAGSYNIGINVAGDHGEIKSHEHRPLKYSGVVVGETIAVKVQGSHNKIDFGSTGKIFTLRRDAESDGRDDTDGRGDGLILKGNDNDVTLAYIRAGDRGVSVSGEGNRIVLNKFAGRPTTYNPDATIMAKVGVEILGKGNTLKTEANIEAREIGILVKGDGFKIQNFGKVKGAVYGAFLKGNGGEFTSASESLKGGSIGLKLVGHNNHVVATNITSSSGSGVEVAGDDNVMAFAGVRTAAKADAVKLTGNHNYVFLTGLSTSSRGILSVKGSSNILEFGSSAVARSLGDGVRMEDGPNMLVNSGKIDAGKVAVYGDGGGIRIHNSGKLYGETGVRLIGKDAWLINAGDITAKAAAIRVKGDDLHLENRGIINGLIGLFLDGSYGVITSSEGSTISGMHSAIQLKGNHNNFKLKGQVVSDIGDAIVINGKHNDLELAAVRSESSRAITINGENNKIVAYGNIESTSSGAVKVAGNSNRITFNATCSGEEEALQISGNHNLITNNGILKSTVSDGASTIKISSYAVGTGIFNNGTIQAEEDQYAIFQPDRTDGYSDGIEISDDIGIKVYNQGVIQGLVKLGSASDEFWSWGEIKSSRSADNESYDVDLGGGNDAYAETEAALTNGIKVYGGLGDDQLSGGRSNNLFYGGDGEDTLIGSYGNDTLNGGSGSDSMYGGEGDDTFVLAFDPAEYMPDKIDFVKGEDVIALPAEMFRDLLTDSSGHILESQIFNVVERGDRPTSPDVRLVYYSKAGILMYADPDGSGPAMDYTLATIPGVRPGGAPHFLLHSSDLILI